MVNSVLGKSYQLDRYLCIQTTPTAHKNPDYLDPMILISGCLETAATVTKILARPQVKFKEQGQRDYKGEGQVGRSGLVSVL